MNNRYFLGIDIGGTWIKGVIYNNVDKDLEYITSFINEKNIFKVKSPLKADSSSDDLIMAINLLIDKIGIADISLSGIAISTAGIVSYDGSKILKAAPHLNSLISPKWKEDIERKFNCPAILINDSDAATIGAVYYGYLSGKKSIGIMPLGTGLGFTVWRNGRLWRPSKVLTLLGSIKTPTGCFDTLASGSALASNHPDNKLDELFIEDKYSSLTDEYLHNLVNIINSAAITYNLDEILIGGGVADAAVSAKFDIEKKLNSLLTDYPPELDKAVKVRLLKEGNRLPLTGAILLALCESASQRSRYKAPYKSIYTETPYDSSIKLEELNAQEIISLLNKAEIESACNLSSELPAIAKVAEKIADRIKKGGRLIYVGAGTSGRIAAMDCVEIPCTYGFDEDKILCYIAGGISDASIEIESSFEEDASSVSEILMSRLTSKDVVIGISASGTAYFVQSALATAKQFGAYCVMIQADTSSIKYEFCDDILSMCSGHEVVAGSTRMKAGTATKKILNYLSSTVMILLGKVAGSYMIDVACINEKLIKRAESILSILYGIDSKRATELLIQNDFALAKVIKGLSIPEK